jgi:hypothetical protein
MNTLLITAGGALGRIFEGEYPQTFCFVPEDCIVFESGGFRLIEGDYSRSGWDVRNMRFNDDGSGQHLFPNTEKPVDALGDSNVKTFLDRIDNVGARA